jgi:ribosomal protein L7/L12
VTWLLIGAGVLLIPLAWWVSQLGQSRDPASPRRQATRITRDEAGVRSLVAQGRQIEAIKLVRELTGLDLLAAKLAVDSLRSGGALPPLAGPRSRPHPDPISDPEFVRLVAAGQTIAAIKRCRELTGLGLAEAKDLVDRLGHGG